MRMVDIAGRYRFVLTDSPSSLARRLSRLDGVAWLASALLDECRFTYPNCILIQPFLQR